MLVTIDTFILERIFTPFAWWFERKTGRTNFYLAWWAYDVSLLTLVMYLGLKLTRTHDLPPFDFVLLPVMLFCMGLLFMGTNNQDEVARRQPHKITIRVETPFGVLLRLGLMFVMLPLDILHVLQVFRGWMSLIMNPAVIEQALWIIQLFSFICGTYLTQVRRPPPRPRREEAKDLQLAPIHAR